MKNWMPLRLGGQFWEGHCTRQIFKNSQIFLSACKCSGLSPIPHLTTSRTSFFLVLAMMGSWSTSLWSTTNWNYHAGLKRSRWVLRIFHLKMCLMHCLPDGALKCRWINELEFALNINDLGLVRSDEHVSLRLWTRVSSVSREIG